MTLSTQLRTFLSLASEPPDSPAADELVRLAEEYREEERRTVNGLTRAQLEAQLASAVERKCWWAEDAIRADLRKIGEL